MLYMENIYCDTLFLVIKTLFRTNKQDAYSD